MQLGGGGSPLDNMLFYVRPLTHSTLSLSLFLLLTLFVHSRSSIQVIHFANKYFQLLRYFLLPFSLCSYSSFLFLHLTVYPYHPYPPLSSLLSLRYSLLPNRFSRPRRRHSPRGSHDANTLVKHTCIFPCLFFPFSSLSFPYYLSPNPFALRSAYRKKDLQDMI